MGDDESVEFRDRNMREYKLRTAYGGLLKKSRHNQSKYNHIQVTHSDGCCSSRDTENNTSQRSKNAHSHHTPRHEAHDRSHLKIDPSNPVYLQHGRVTKNYNRTKKSNDKNNLHSTGQTNNNYNSGKSTVPTTKKSDCCCCCTIL